MMTLKEFIEYVPITSTIEVYDKLNLVKAEAWTRDNGKLEINDKFNWWLNWKVLKVVARNNVLFITVV